MPSYKRSVISPPISHVSTLSKFFSSTMAGQNIQCTNAPSKSVTYSTVKSKRVNSDINVIRKNTVNGLSSDDFTPQCYSDILTCPKLMAGKIVSFC